MVICNIDLCRHNNNGICYKDIVITDLECMSYDFDIESWLERERNEVTE